MPACWYNIGACKDNKFNQSICANVKPYFMIYIYDEIKSKYKKYIKESELSCKKLFACTIQELQNKSISEKLSEQETEFLFWYNYKMPVGLGACTMNRICWYVESQLDGYKSQLKKSSTFDYSVLKVKRNCTTEHKNQLAELEQTYREHVKQFKATYDPGLDEIKHIQKRMHMISWFKEKAQSICPNDDERMNIILTMTYEGNGNRQFCWDTIGELIIKRLNELKGGDNECI